MQAAITAAYDANHRYLELQWPTVPNLEEIAAGTKLNFEFGKHISQYLGMTSAADYMLIKRYLAQFANLYWTILVAECTPFKSRTVWAVFSDGVTKTSATARLQNVQLASMRRPPEAIGEDDVVVIVDPRATEAWKRGLKMKPKNGCVVFLNSQFNESYGLTGPRNGDLKHVEGVYFLKRVTRGYAFRAFPGAWRACLERPDLVVEEVGRFEKLPSLREIAGIVRETSNQRYGGLYNDRYVKGFGGRL